MRIIEQYKHGPFQVTIFRMDNKFSVKLEQDLLEQTYKFREGHQIESLEDVQRLLDEGFFAMAQAVFSQMQQLRQKALDASRPEDDFPLIL